MISYKESLAKIGITSGPVSYLSFYSRPKSLRQAIRSMDAPRREDWQQVSDIHIDENWTEECQGVAWDGVHWIFSSNGSGGLGSNPKGLYIFNGGTPFKDDNIVRTIDLRKILNVDHIGQLCFYEGSLYISHLANNYTSIIVFKDNNGSLEYSKEIILEKVTSPTTGFTDKVEFQAINPWDGMAYTCFGNPEMDYYELFIHDLNSGKWTGRTLQLTSPNAPIGRVQGAFFSSNGHLYVACDRRWLEDLDYKEIRYFSALNGHYLGDMPLTAEEDDQELEGICYAEVQWQDGRRAQVHAVLLENRNLAKDNIYFKSFYTSKQDII